MSQPQVLIVRAPGTNCDEETAFAFEQAGGRPRRVHVNRLLEKPDLADRFQILCIPGGFSYGDDVAAGRILAERIRHHLADAMARFRDAGKLILGICNGFQVLIKSSILVPDDPEQGPAATLTWNDSRRFEDLWVKLEACCDGCVFLEGIESMYLPIAHAEGKFVARDEATLGRLARDGRLVLRYAGISPRTVGRLPYPENPNGSQADVAGMCDATGRVLGLMPHPERHIDPTQHPRWTRGEAPAVGDGLALFQNAVRFFR